MCDEELDAHREHGAGASLPEPGVQAREEASEFRFTLYICGATERSQRAVANVRRLCDGHLPGRYSLEIIDLYRQPELAHSRDIFAIPTLIQELPLPFRRFIGDLADNERLVVRMATRGVIDQKGR
jgi:circadian clock protein KaiB